MVELEIDEQRSNRPLLDVGEAEAEEAFGGGVGELEGGVGVDDEDALLDGLEDGFEESAFGDKAGKLCVQRFGVDALDAGGDALVKIRHVRPPRNLGGADACQ